MKLHTLRLPPVVAWLLFAVNAAGQGQFYFNNRIGTEVSAQICATWREAATQISSIGSPDWAVQLFSLTAGNQLIALDLR